MIWLENQNNLDATCRKIKDGTKYLIIHGNQSNGISSQRISAATGKREGMIIAQD